MRRGFLTDDYLQLDGQRWYLIDTSPGKCLVCGVCTGQTLYGRENTLTWNRYVATFEVVDGKLRLPSWRSQKNPWRTRYEKIAAGKELDENIAYTGWILVYSGTRDEGHWLFCDGLQDLVMAQRALELRFEEGKLVERHDLANAIDELWRQSPGMNGRDHPMWFQAEAVELRARIAPMLHGEYNCMANSDGLVGKFHGWGYPDREREYECVTCAKLRENGIVPLLPPKKRKHGNSGARPIPKHMPDWVHELGVVQGYASRITKVASVLFPADLFDKTRPYSSFRTEYEAAVEEARFDVLLFDQETFDEGRGLVFDREPSNPSLPLVLRGWMMDPEEYRRFHDGLEELGLSPLVSPGAYEEMHLFPNAYAHSEKLRALTPKAMAFPGTHVDASAVNASFDRFMVKDYVKSAKMTGFPAFFEAPVGQVRMDEIVAEFLEIRGKLFTEGIVIKEFIDLKRYGEQTNEWRAFYVCGNRLNICRNSNQLANVPIPPDSIVDACAGMGSPYYTVDFAETVEGSWVVIEVGDGQVSGLAAAQNPVIYYRVLADGLGRRNDGEMG